MAKNGEVIGTSSEIEVINRRTDDILFNVHYLASNIIDYDNGVFSVEAENDVLEQDETDIAEADIHKLAPIVYQKFDPQLRQYVTLGTGTVDNAVRGCSELNMEDPASEFEFYRRTEEVTDEVTILDPEVKAQMRSGKKKIFISASPTHHEADPDVADSFGYDERTMFRIQSLSPDGQTKSMQNFGIFNVPAKAWANFLGARYGEYIEPTALAVMQFCNQVILEPGTNEEIIEEFMNGVMPYVEANDQPNVERQLDAFLHEQVELKEQAKYYANDKLAIEKELALSLNDWARQSVINIVLDAYAHLNPAKKELKELLDQRFVGGRLFVDEDVAKLIMSIKTVTVDNRAGLATLNERTVMRVASRIGLEAALEIAAREKVIQQMLPELSNEFMVRRSDRLIAEAGLGCGGACSVAVLDVFSDEAKTAREAGLSGKLYTSDELDKNSKCTCFRVGKKAKVISDGKNAICVTCGTFQVNGKRGNLKKAE